MRAPCRAQGAARAPSGGWRQRRGRHPAPFWRTCDFWGLTISPGAGGLGSGTRLEERSAAFATPSWSATFAQSSFPSSCSPSSFSFGRGSISSHGSSSGVANCVMASRTRGWVPEPIEVPTSALVNVKWTCLMPRQGKQQDQCWVYAACGLARYSLQYTQVQREGSFGSSSIHQTIPEWYSVRRGRYGPG